jgi:hypothetical protein
MADTRMPCKGITAAKYDREGKVTSPARPCRGKARPGRDYCPQHEPDQEFNEAVRRQHIAEQERSDARKSQRLRDQRLDWRHAVERRLAQLATMTLVLDSSPHRCPTAGVLSFGYPDHHGDWVTPADYELPELVQCERYLGHPAGQHLCLDAVLRSSYGQAGVKVEWRD